MTEDEYNAIDAVRWSHLSRMATSPLAYLHAKSSTRKDTPSMARGRFVHSLVLEPGQAKHRYAVFEGVRRGKAWDKFQADNAGKEIVTASEMEEAHPIARAVLDHPLAGPMFSRGEPEVTLVWVDELTGIRCKSRLDWLDEGVRRPELKVVASLDRIESTVVKYKWHGQIAFHGMGLTHDVPPVFVFVEAGPPYDVLVCSVPDETLDAGRRLARRLLDRLAECLESDEWPGLTQDEPKPLYLPEWALEEAAGPSTLDLGNGVRIAV